MQAIWQMVDAIIISVMTYSCEGWDINKEGKNKHQTITNEALRTILYLPKGTSTTILLNASGDIPIDYIIKRKQRRVAHQRCNQNKPKLMEEENEQSSRTPSQGIDAYSK